ncbi:MAG: efflux RND transporter periplasmic adaptor subunit [Pseudomonadota bacterium]
MLKSFALIAVLMLVTACEETDSTTEAPPPVRGLITTLVEDTGQSLLRRYPGVLEPKEISTLSFEVSGRLGELILTVGQEVQRGEQLANLDARQFEVEIENREAAVAEAEALFNQDSDDVQRQKTLFERGAATRLSVDEAGTDFRASQARLTQAQKSLVSAQEDLADATLYAPFGGIINSVNADSFQTVSAGEAIASIYNPNAFEVSFSVNFEIISRINVGMPAVVRLADDPSIALLAVVTEVGKRADTVSSFPVIVSLAENNPFIKAGMSVEVELEFPIPANEGFLIPLSAAIADRELTEDAGPARVTDVAFYVFDPATSTVKRRQAKMAGIRENMFMVIEGLEPGERVATAGVSFLHEGMEVRLIDDTSDQ